MKRGRRKRKKKKVFDRRRGLYLVVVELRCGVVPMLTLSILIIYGDGFLVTGGREASSWFSSSPAIHTAVNIFFFVLVFVVVGLVL